MRITTGIDIVEIHRIRQILDKYGEKFIERVFCGEEREYAMRKVDPAIHLSGFWVAKEASIKALGDCAPKKLNRMCVTHIQDGKPIVKLPYSNISSLSQIDLSISHTRSHAVAVTVALWKDETE